MQNTFTDITHGKYTKIENNRSDELGDLFNKFNFMVDQLKEKELIKSLMGRFISKDIADQIIKNERKLNGELTNVTILFCDLKNFSEITSKLPIKFVLSTLNEYFDKMVEIIIEHKGYVDKFMGDGIMAVFSEIKEETKSCIRAVNATNFMIRECKTLNMTLGLTDFKLENYFGIHYGPVVSGLIGSTERMEYTVIGDTVNISERSLKLNKTFNSKIAISETVFKRLDITQKKLFQPAGPQKLKGIKNPVNVFLLK